MQSDVDKNNCQRSSSHSAPHILKIYFDKIDSQYSQVLSGSLVICPSSGVYLLLTNTIGYFALVINFSKPKWNSLEYRSKKLAQTGLVFKIYTRGVWDYQCDLKLIILQGCSWQLQHNIKTIEHRWSYFIIMNESWMTFSCTTRCFALKHFCKRSSNKLLNWIWKYFGLDLEGKVQMMVGAHCTLSGSLAIAKKIKAPNQQSHLSFVQRKLFTKNKCLFVMKSYFLFKGIFASLSWNLFAKKTEKKFTTKFVL